MLDGFPISPIGQQKPPSVRVVVYVAVALNPGKLLESTFEQQYDPFTEEPEKQYIVSLSRPLLDALDTFVKFRLAILIAPKKNNEIAATSNTVFPNFFNIVGSPMIDNLEGDIQS